MAARTGDPSRLTEARVDELAREFLQSPYADSAYIDWTLDRRLEGFLHRCGLDYLIEDGDAYDLVLERVMVHIGTSSRPGFGNAPRRRPSAN